MTVAKPTERPAFGTAPIRCGKTRCKWRGFETALREIHTTRWTQKVCPACGCDSYIFMTPKEIQAWERSKTPSDRVEGRDACGASLSHAGLAGTVNGG